MRRIVLAFATAGLLFACGSDDESSSPAATGGSTSAATGGSTSAGTGGDTSAATGGDTSAATGGDTSAATGGDTSTTTPSGGTFDFESDTAGEVPAGFTAETGTADATWSTADDSGNKVVQVKAPTGGPAYTLMSDSAVLMEGTIEVKARIDAEPGDPRCGLTFFGVDADNFVYAAINSVEGNVHSRYFEAGERKKHEGDPEEMLTVAVGTWYDLKVVIAGDSVKVSVDGTELLDFTNSVIKGGRVGLFGRNSECSFDDLKITPS